jgi:hypothetical protein
MFKLILSALWTALGIVVAGLVQVAVTTLWPGIQRLPSAGISIDSYVVVLLMAGLCFFAGQWARRNVSTVAGAACAAIVPLAWLALFVTSTMIGVGPVAWLRPLTVLSLFAAAAPLIGVAAGWMSSSPKYGRELHAV